MASVKLTTPSGEEVYKDCYLYDGDGNKLKRKIRRDEKGLYVIRYGAKGRLKKRIQNIDCGDINFIIVHRQVDYYET